ncbi:MAG: arginine--tRNA ligase [Oscillospiraceae bacterium]|nr:arginine--tRNA ligase [Oscillospiraceae bacterium]
MTDPVKETADSLKALVRAALEAAAAEKGVDISALPEINIEIPADSSHGDFATNAALASARALHSSPRDIAADICARLDLSGTYFEKVETAGPGFINFFLSKDWFGAAVSSVISAGARYGTTSTGGGKKILLEFVSANPTGPMHIGNARGGAIGDCLASVLEAAGYNVCREFYVNDAGNQVNKFGRSLELRYMQLNDPENADFVASFDNDEELCQAIFSDTERFPMPEDVYLGADIIAHAKRFTDINGDKYYSADEEERRAALVNYALPLNIAGLERDLGRYRIIYDNWFRESTLHSDGSVERIIQKLKDSGYTYEQEGALWFASSRLGDDKDRVLVRANGVPTYFVPDIAYHYNKLSERGFDTAIDILGADHHGYIPRMKAAMQALGVDPERLDMVIMQMVSLIDGEGNPIKQSKRSGKAISLVTLLDEIPIDAARFFFNLREANSQFEMDLDLAIEQSSKNPVYYVQYAHARICSIIRGLKGKGIFADRNAKPVYTEPEEIELIRELSILPGTVDAAAAAYDPSKLTKYAVELASCFHKFYDKCRIMGESEDVLQSRLMLCNAVRITIENVFAMLKITCPDKM